MIMRAQMHDYIPFTLLLKLMKTEAMKKLRKSDDDARAHTHEDRGGDVNCHRTSCIVWAACLTSLSMIIIIITMMIIIINHN